MQILTALKWINRHSVSPLLALLLLGASALAHVLAHFRMDMAGRQFAFMDDRTIRQMGLIDFIDSHYGVAIAYGAVFLGCLLWLEIRAAPRWAVWVTFGVLALPCLVYADACTSIGGKFISWTTL